MESNKEIIRSLVVLNGAMLEHIDREGYERFCPDLLTLTSDGTHNLVMFMGVLIWSSESDARTFSVTNESYEPLEGFLRNEVRELLKVINKLKL